MHALCTLANSDLLIGGMFDHVGTSVSPYFARFSCGGCPADFNHDGQLDLFDYLDFTSALAAESRAADFNNDNIVDFFDYLDFVQAFSTGC